MSGSRRGAIFAFGLIAGICLFPFIGLIADYTNPPIESDANFVAGEEEHDDRSQNSKQYPYFGFWKWSGHLIESGDTLAQWIMMVFTVIAAGLLLVTLFVTLRMARDTRKIGEAQVRAYIKCSKVICKPLGDNGQDDIFSLNIELQNFGQSPATIVQLLIGIELMRFDGTRAGNPLQINSPIDPAMAPQGAATAMLSFGYAAGAADEVRNSKAYMRFTVALVFDDVFGKRTKFITYHHTEGSLLDSGITASHIVGVKPEHKPK